MFIFECIKGYNYAVADSLKFICLEISALSV